MIKVKMKHKIDTKQIQNGYNIDKDMLLKIIKDV